MIQSTYLKGIFAEFYVLLFLILKGYRPVKWRMRNKISEIDLIVAKRNILVAIEVKYRRSYDQGLYAINAQQKQKIRNAFMLFSQRYPKKIQIIRCDVCIVSRSLKIFHLENAF